jgi:Arc/MetJ-type ribon-helix-helix transcriptional regulator
MKTYKNLASVIRSVVTEMRTKDKAHEYNLDAAQREMDRRHAEGEDMTGAKIDKKTYEIVKARKAMQQKMKESFDLDITDEEADDLLESIQEISKGE